VSFYRHHEGLYDYQKCGAEFLAVRRRAYLADVPGLGKTAQALVAADLIDAKNIVVVCPASAVPVWEREAERWWRPWMGRRMAIVSYNKLARVHGATPLDDPSIRPLDLVILDEAHYCKSPKAKRTKAAMRLAAYAERAWLLSGSPMPNNPTELWTMFHYLWRQDVPSEAQTYADWRDYFCKWYHADHGPRVTGTKPTVAELRTMLSRVMLRRRVSDVGLQLPPLRLHVVPLPADRRFAEELETLIEEEGIETATVRRLLGAHKAERIARVICDEAPKKIVVMYHHRDTGALLTKALQAGGYMVFGFDGSTPSHVRGHEVEQFQTFPFPDKYAAFVVQQQAGGVAITLTAAAEIILVEPDWSPEANVQAIKRIHRISQTDPCRARIFSVEESLDDGIMKTLAAKIQMRKEVL